MSVIHNSVLFYLHQHVPHEDALYVGPTPRDNLGDLGLPAGPRGGAHRHGTAGHVLTAIVNMAGHGTVVRGIRSGRRVRAVGAQSQPQRCFVVGHMQGEWRRCSESVTICAQMICVKLLRRSAI